MAAKTGVQHGKNRRVIPQKKFLSTTSVAAAEPRVCNVNLGSLGDLGALPDMPSLPSLQRFIAERPDFPIIERGRAGRPFVFDLAQAAAFVRANWVDRRTAQARPAVHRGQLSLFDTHPTKETGHD